MKSRGHIGGSIYNSPLNWQAYWTQYLSNNILILTISSTLLWGLWGMGILKSILKKEWGLILFGLISVGGYFWMMHWFPYGAYKFIVLGLWLNIFFVVGAIDWLTSKVPCVKIIPALFLLIVFFLFFHEQLSTERASFQNFGSQTGLPLSITQANKVHDIALFVVKNNVKMAIPDGPLLSMAVYFLYSMKILECPYNFCPIITKSKTTNYFLTVKYKQNGILLWHEFPYYLYQNNSERG